MEQHGHEAHVGQFAVVLHERAASGRHLVATIEAELCLGVVFPQGQHQVRGMQVAAGLACYEVVLHLLTIRR